MLMLKKLLSEIPKSLKLVVELGTGDGSLIKNLSEKEKENYFVGIEIDPGRFQEAYASIKANNVKLINGSFEEILPLFEDNCINRVIYILPDPKFIDRNYKQKWSKLYKIIYDKLEHKGTFVLITEITDELFQPVSDELFFEEMSSLKAIFESIGFNTVECTEGTPEYYNTYFTNIFKGDTQRIRIIFFKFEKSLESKNLLDMKMR